MDADRSAAPHLEAGEVAAYLDRRLSAADRTRLEAHLAECAECRAEVVAVAGLLRSRLRQHWPVIVPAAAAAAVALLFLFPRATDDAGPLMRSGAGAAALEVVAPAEGAVLAPGAVRFVWRGLGASVPYTVTVTRGDGDVLWRATLPDTTASLPGDVTLERGRSFYWYVDALLPDGRSVTSGVRELRLAP